MSKPVTLHIGIYYGTSTMSRITRFRTWSEQSHASLIFNFCRADEEVIEAVGRGVVRHAGLDDFHKPGTRVEIYRVQATEEQIAKVYDFALKQVGKPYDWGGLFAFIPRLAVQNPDKWFCSELVFEACAAGEIKLLVRIPAYKVAPCQLYTCPALVIDAVYFTKGETPRISHVNAPKTVSGVSEEPQATAINMQCVCAQMQCVSEAKRRSYAY